MARKRQLRHERLRIYRMQMIVVSLMRRITDGLSEAEGGLAETFDRASITLLFKIIRGSCDWKRAESRRHFREAGRAAQLCESCLLGFGQQGAGRPLDRRRAVLLLREIQARIEQIVARIDSGLSRADAMREA